jgi:CRP-like cAMP-binding protein/di/tricarboxylate transporter
MIDLPASPLFAGFSRTELAHLVATLEEQAFAAGAVVFHQGEPGQYLYIVRAGVAEARVGPAGEGDYPLALFEPGDCFGEMALLTDAPRSTTIVALTDLELWALSKDRFQALVEQTPRLALTVGRLLSARLEATNQTVSTMRGISDVAAEQVYRGLDPKLQRFLLRTAPLDPVRPDVVAHALGSPEAERILADLADRLPLVTVAAQGAYRYHRLFRERLLEKLSAELGEQGLRAWLGELARSARAVRQPEQALGLLVSAGDTEAAQELVISEARARLASGDLEVVERLLATLPPAMTRSRDELVDLRADLLVNRGRPLEAIGVLAEAAAPDAVQDEARLVQRHRRLAELNFQLGRSGDGMRWLQRAGEVDAQDHRTIVAVEPLASLPHLGRIAGAAHLGLLALASLAGLRRSAATAGALGGWGVSRPLGFALSALLLLYFAATGPPDGLSRAAYLALGLLIGALPLLVFSVFADDVVALLLVAAWAGFGLVPARVAVSGFATPGWFLVLAVLAVGVALARSGLLYRFVLGLLARVPSNHTLLSLALAGVGVAFTAVMPNAVARAALAAPLALEISDALGYARRSRGSAAIAMAVLLGFGQMAALFLTGSAPGLLIYGLLPPDSRARFGFANWFLAALPLHVVIFVLTYLAILLLLRPEAPVKALREQVRVQRHILGPLGRGEGIAAAVFVLLVLAFVLAPSIGVDPAWPAVLAMAVLMATNVLDQQGFKSGINWSFLLFFGVILSMVEVFATLKIDAWLGAVASYLLAPLAASPALFVVALGLAGYVLNFVVRWQAASPLMALVLIPVVAPFGIEPWVVGMVALVATNMWYLPYQSITYQALYYGADEQAFSHAQVRPIALIYGLACLVGLVATVPVWRAMGLLP